MSPEEQFAAHLAAGQVQFQRCGSCSTLRSTPRAVCHRCLSREASWEPAPQEGTVVSCIVAHEAIATSVPPPYTVVHVDFGNAVRFTANLIGDGPPAAVGMPVRFVIAERAGRPLAQFERAAPYDAAR
ncbi:MAG: DNA-binding protein [Conexibacter sp.]|nr:DNA-binding protein [Conexibacter sp.]